MAFTPGQDALPNPSPGSGLMIDANGNPVAPAPLAPQPGSAAAAAADPPTTAAESYEIKDVELQNNGSLRYPSDIGTPVSDYMIFEFLDYVPPFSSKVNIADAASYNAYNASINNLKRANGYNQVILYMPEGVSVSYKANWDGKKFGNIAAGILSAAGGAAGGDVNKFFKSLGETASDTAKRAPAQIGAGAVSAIIGSITGDSVSSNDIFSAVGGQILNPNAELLFGGHDLRTFTFSYKLVPYNLQEAKNIFDKGGIIYSFKKAMLPSFEAGEFTKGTGSDFSTVEKNNKLSDQIGFIKNPKLVQPYFMFGNGNHPYLPRLKPCTITDFDVNYTADGVYAAHAEGYPAAAEITVSLTETKLVYADDIDKGF